MKPTEAHSSSAPSRARSALVLVLGPLVLLELALIAAALSAGLVAVDTGSEVGLAWGLAVPAVYAVALLLLARLMALPLIYMLGAKPFRAAYSDAIDSSREQAYTDHLTSLPNRRHLYEALETTLEVTPPDSTAALLYLDLDGFKELNDALGHGAGDTLLCLVGGRLSGALRGGDTLARLGGDEFAVLLPDSSEMAALEVVGRIQRALQPAFPVPGMGVHVEASIGIAVYPGHGRTAEALVQHADVAMYQAKTARTGFEIYAPERDGSDRGRLGLLGELRRAIDEDELELHFQPQVELSTRAVVGVEALVRWRHPERGLLMPADFLPMAEQTGLMRSLTSWVLDRALGQTRAWLDEGRELTMAVNLSVPNVLDLKLPGEVARLLAHWRVPPRLVQLEVTENVVLADPVRATSVLGRLKDLGVRLSLDDFGTGQSSLAYLKDLPVDELKIDKSFVMHITEDPRDAAIVHSTIELGSRLGMRVLAEGLESEGAWAQLASYGCERAQGFHVSKALPQAELEHWFVDWSARGSGDRPPAEAEPVTLLYRGSQMRLPGRDGPSPAQPPSAAGRRTTLRYRGSEIEL